MIPHLPFQASLLLESAIRSLLLALAVWIGLRVFRVRNVLSQKAAWGVVLASALAMPVVLPMASHWSVLPANVRVTIPSDPQTLLEELQARIQAKTSANITAPAAAVASPVEHPAEAVTPESSENSAVETDTSNVSSVDTFSAEPLHPAAAALQSAPTPRRPSISALQILLLLYLAVAAVLLIRVAIGLLAALRLLRTAKPVLLDVSPDLSSCNVRCSARIGSPVTIFSSILLPPNYTTWSDEQLRIVLAHECSHIRQRDFYLQLLAGIYAAVVWFSPLGWWLKRKLSDLAEAISDRAGLEVAADRTSYAQLLLHFAAVPRPTVIGVAMARSGSLSRRIERLLNDKSFRQAFAGNRRALVAVLILPVTLFAATTLVRVQAAGQEPAVPPAPTIAPGAPGVVAPQAPSPAPEPAAGVSTPEPISADDVTPAPAAAPQTAPVAAPDIAPAPSVILVAPQPPHSPDSAPTAILVAPAAPPGGRLVIAPPKAPAFSSGIMVRSMLAQADAEGSRSLSYRYSDSDGESYAIVHNTDSKQNVSFNGGHIHTADINRVRKQAHGDFLWFTRDGKSYFVDDPATVSQIEAMYKPMEELGRQQEELGKQQEVLGKQQEELGRQQESASVPTPDMSKEIAEVTEAMARLKADQGKNMTQAQFAELQEKLAELQGKLGEIQGKIGSKQGEFGARMGELGEKMGELGAKQGELGEKQGRIAQEADQKVKSIIDESLKNGKAHPVQ